MEKLKKVLTNCEICGSKLKCGKKFCSLHCSLIGNKRWINRKISGANTDKGIESLSKKALLQWKNGSLKGHKQTENQKLLVSMANKGINRISKERRRETTKNWISKLGHPKGMLGKHHSNTTKKIMSEKHIGKKLNISKENRQLKSDRMLKMISLLPKGRWYSGRHPKIGKRKDLNNMFFRSSWEANYARYLNWLKEKKFIKDWEYEPKTFIFTEIQLGTRSYKPDFLVTENNGDKAWHEVKGWMDSKSKIKLKRMKKYYPEEKIILIDGDAYKSIKQKMSRIIENWE